MDGGISINDASRAAPAAPAARVVPPPPGPNPASVLREFDEVAARIESSVSNFERLLLRFAGRLEQSAVVNAALEDTAQRLDESAFFLHPRGGRFNDAGNPSDHGDHGANPGGFNTSG